MGIVTTFKQASNYNEVSDCHKTQKRNLCPRSFSHSVAGLKQLRELIVDWTGLIREERRVAGGTEEVGKEKT